MLFLTIWLFFNCLQICGIFQILVSYRVTLKWVDCICIEWNNNFEWISLLIQSLDMDLILFLIGFLISGAIVLGQYWVQFQRITDMRWRGTNYSWWKATWQMTRAVRREGKGKKKIVAIASYWGEDYGCACVGGRIKNNIFCVMTFLRLCHELSNERLANTFQRMEENTHYHKRLRI